MGTAGFVSKVLACALVSFGFCASGWSAPASGSATTMQPAAQPAGTAGTGALIAVRPRRPEEAVDARKAVAVTILTVPAGAAVYRGRRRLGPSPVALSTASDTPVDITVRAKGYMTLHTRVARRSIGRKSSGKRTYTFVLSPAKL